jgi:hypothetical protein
MVHERPRPHLQLVKPPEPVVPAVREADFAPAVWQSTLFAGSNQNLLALIDLNSIEEADFLTLLLAAKPRFMIDLRVLPLFDLGSMNRKRAFELFEKTGTKYFDISGRLDIKDRSDSRFNPEFLSDRVREIVFSKSGEVVGPVCFLIDPIHFNDDFLGSLSQKLDTTNPLGWETLKIPGSRPERDPTSPLLPPQVEDVRKVVFISHANPEDNIFAAWLSARLSTAGYEVWTDVDRLAGGEKFWDDIEITIREHCAKVVVVLSKNAQSKNGVLDEINLAVSVERKDAIKNFVVPIRIDDLAFDEVRANLARKNIVDFKSNWASGLAQLLKSFERDRVPKTNIDGSVAFSRWLEKNVSPPALLSATPELLISNWLPITGFPKDIVLHEINADSRNLTKLTTGLPFPTFRYLRLVGGFCSAEDLQPVGVEQALFKENYRIPLHDFLEGRPTDLPGLERRDAQNFVSSLLRQSWDNFAIKRGLTRFETASGSAAWFVAKDLIDQDQATFVDTAGKVRKRKLVGRSEKRAVYWHYGVEMRPALGRLPHFSLRAHVVFTEDGRRLIPSKERMHSLRRSFCRSWWNDRWRDLLQAFTNWLSSGDETVALPTGSEGLSILLETKPSSMISPFSLVEHSVEELPDDVADAMDWDTGEDDIDLGELDLADEAST